MILDKIISGGQTGADRAALDFAIAHNIPHGGWLPSGRKTEEGPLPDKYRLQELSTDSYSDRTEKNVLASDGTLIVSHGELKGGSALTEELARKHRKFLLHLDMDELSRQTAAVAIRSWIEINDIKILNVAGARDSKDPRIYRATRDLLEEAFALP